MAQTAPHGLTEAQGREVLLATRPYARASDGLAAWQVLSTLAGVVLTLALARSLGTHPARFLLSLLLAGLLTRVFVLQHDCGHHSLFHLHRVNDAVGYALSFFTGVPYEAWRFEHNWHHNHQGKLSRRGIDRVNSPMTCAEAQAKPENARARARLINVRNIFVLGFISLVVQRKRGAGFFFSRPAWRGPLANPEGIKLSLWLTPLGHVLFHAGVIAALGWGTWAGVLLVAYLVAGGLAALAFWVQHNFPRTYHAGDADWSFASVAVQGSSYLRMPWLLNYFYASIGLHHVHHLNPRIPNYRLEAARVAIPQLAGVAPLTGLDLRRAFTHVFWDERAGQMTALAETELAPAQSEALPASATLPK